MLKIILKKAVSIGLVSAVILSGLVGCSEKADTTTSTTIQEVSGSEIETSDTSSTVIEPVEISVMIGPSSLSSGILTGDIPKEIFEKKFGLIMNNIFAGDKFNERVSTLMASDSMPDLICFKDKQTFQTAADAGLLLDLSTLVEENGTNLNANTPAMLSYMKDTFGGGTKLYGLASMVGASQPTNDIHLALYGRSDAYNQIGAPEMKTYADVLNTLKLMQDAYPKTEDGQNVYALELWSDWDSISMSLNDYTISSYMGVNPNVGSLQFAEYDLNDMTLKNVFDTDSTYFKSVQFYNKAYQMGILDPDSITQTWPNAESKVKNGQSLTAYWGWMRGVSDGSDFVKANPQAGMIPFFPTEEGRLNLLPEYPVGRDYIFAINANCKVADRIVQLLDYCASVEGSMTMMDGIKGKTWDVVDGVPQYTDEVLQKVMAADSSILGDYNYEGFTMLNKWNIDPATNVSITFEGWPQFTAGRATQAIIDWQKAHNTDSVFNWAKANLATVQDDGIQSQAAAPGDEIKVIQQRLGELLKEYSWKMVYSNSDAEYEAVKAELIDKATQVGSDEVFAWAQGAFNDAKNAASKYTEYTIQ